ncbi:unnamed protein product [Closterium sp. NIES-54]
MSIEDNWTPSSKHEPHARCTAQVVQHPLTGLPLLWSVSPGCNVACQDAKRVGKVRSSAGHQLVDFAAACCFDYAASLVAESVFDCPPSVGGECALDTDVLEDRQEDFECLAAAVPHLVAMPLAPEGDPDAPDIPTPRS